MAPGVGHCGGGDGPQPQGLFEALVSWVEQGKAPDQIMAIKTVAGAATLSRPLCRYPSFARWTGAGSSDDAANFVCRASFGRNTFDSIDAEDTWEHD
ncbi:MAG: tannase/feruloyl esterase family alpha/beta hydrolase [Gammaproteobacteria bacterium]|nr:MAG: tannase/feruloyl esterase family alpha/beta hydrolase [Gammaproteobacteria bacterium]